MTDTDNFFKPGSVAANLSRNSKSALTDTTAKGILAVEAAARAEKTAHLRNLRLQASQTGKQEDAEGE